MWDFSQYASGKRAFSFSQGASAMMGAGSGAGAGAGAGMGAGTGAGTGTGAQASRTTLKILYKSSSEYLGTLVAATGALATESFVSEGPVGWSDNLSLDLEGEKESRGPMERATEGMTEGYLRRGHLRPQTEVVLELISSKTLFQTSWLTHWVWRN